MNHKVTKTCSSCETKYTIARNIDEQEAVWSNEDEDDNWN